MIGPLNRVTELYLIPAVDPTHETDEESTHA